MSWTLKRKAQALLAAEEGTIRKDWGGRLPIALVYPNTYAVGMSNLGFQTMYWHLNQLRTSSASAPSFLTRKTSTSWFAPAVRPSRWNRSGR